MNPEPNNIEPTIQPPRGAALAHAKSVSVLNGAGYGALVMGFFATMFGVFGEGHFLRKGLLGAIAGAFTGGSISALTWRTAVVTPYSHPAQETNTEFAREGDSITHPVHEGKLAASDIAQAKS